MNSINYLQQINNIRKKRGYQTNAVLTMPQLQAILEKAGTKVLTKEGLLVILEVDGGLLRTYYYAEDDTNLKLIGSLLPKVESLPIIIDIVSKNGHLLDSIEMLVNSGFKLYDKYIRMSTNNLKRPLQTDFSNIEMSTESDVSEISEIISQEFDMLTAHLPTIEDILKAISLQEIFVFRKQNKIAGVLFLESKSSKNFIWRYVVVRKEFRNQKIISKLIAFVAKDLDENTLHMLWVSERNNAKMLYQSLNFSSDGLEDYILLFKEEV